MSSGTWTVRAEVANLNSKLANVTATRTEGELVKEFTLRNMSLDTHDKPEEVIRAAIVAKVEEEYVKAVAADVKAAAILAGWEAALATDLNALET